MPNDHVPDHVELLVIGGGPGGYAAAFEAARLGLDVTLIDADDALGGVCLRRGCIPSKTLLQLSELIHAASAAGAAGLEFSAPKIDLDAIREHKNALIGQLTSGVAHLCEQRGVRVLQGRARFVDDGELQLDGHGGRRLAFDTAVIATGSRPTALPGTDFGKRIMSSTEALELVDIPSSLLVIGGGYIGLEMGMVYQALGSRVTLVEATDRLMPGADADLVEPLARAARQRFDAIHLNTQVSALRPGEVDVTITLDSTEARLERRFDRVLVAVGRTPNTDDLGLDAAGIVCDDHGFVIVDAARRSSAPRIHAIGDAAGGMLLAHEAMHEGKVAARAIAGQDAAFDPRAVPAVVFTDPQVAWCGLTAADVERTERNIKILRFPWQASGRAISMGASHGMSKILADANTGRVLGMGMVGPQAESMIAEGVLAIEMGATSEDLASSIHPHPTLSETLGEAAELFSGPATHYGP